MAIRFSAGMFSVLILPAYAVLNARWFSRGSYGRAQTFSFSGFFLSPFAAYPLASWIILNSSWQSLFYMNAVLGGVWLLSWMMLTTRTAAKYPSQSAGEATPASTIESSWAVILSPQVLLLALSYLCFAYVYQSVVLLLPTFLVQARGLSFQELMGWMGKLLPLAAFVGVISGGLLSDGFLRRGNSIRFSRVQGPSLGIAVAVPFLIIGVLIPQASVTIVCFSLSMFFAHLALGGYLTIPLELSPRHAGAIIGVLILFGSIANIFAGPLAIRLAVSGDQNIPFLVAAGVAVIAFLILYFLVIPAPIAVTNTNTLVGGGAFAALGFLLFLWVSRHSPYMDVGSLLTQGSDHYLIKEPFYTVTLLLAAGLGLIGLALCVVGVAAYINRS